MSKKEVYNFDASGGESLGEDDVSDITNSETEESGKIEQLSTITPSSDQIEDEKEMHEDDNSVIKMLLKDLYGSELPKSNESQISEVNSMPIEDVPEVESPASDSGEQISSIETPFVSVPPIESDFDSPIIPSDDDSVISDISDDEPKKTIATKTTTKATIPKLKDKAKVQTHAQDHAQAQLPTKESAKTKAKATSKGKTRNEPLVATPNTNKKQKKMELFIKESDPKEKREIQVYQMITKIQKFFKNAYSVPQILSTIHSCAGDVKKAVSIIATSGPVGDAEDLLKTESVQALKPLYKSYFCTNPPK